MDDRIEKTARILSITPEEAAKVIEDDFIIDTGGRCEWEPSEAEEKRLRKLGKLNVRNYKEQESAQLMALKGDK